MSAKYSHSAPHSGSGREKCRPRRIQRLPRMNQRNRMPAMLAPQPLDKPLRKNPRPPRPQQMARDAPSFRATSSTSSPHESVLTARNISSAHAAGSSPHARSAHTDAPDDPNPSHAPAKSPNAPAVILRSDARTAKHHARGGRVNIAILLRANLRCNSSESPIIPGPKLLPRLQKLSG
jgi:hypothetical protein